MTAPKPLQLVARYDNSLVCLTSAGELFEQQRAGWTQMAGPEDGERITGIAARPNGTLVAITGSGRVYEGYRSGAVLGDYSQSWRPLPDLP